MTTPDRTRTVRELGGEMWAELTYAFAEDDPDWKTREAALDIVMGVLARHVGTLLVNDSDLPVAPLPHHPKEIQAEEQ